MSARWRTPVVLWLLALVATGGFAASLDPAVRSTFTLSRDGDLVAVGDLVLPALATVVVLGAAMAALAVAATLAARSRGRAGGGFVAGVAGLLVAQFLVWAVAGSSLPLPNLLQGAVFLATPLALGAMSGVLCERAGVINIAIEGHLLFGAFASATTASLTGSAIAGLVAAVVAGVLLASLLAVFAIRFVVDQIVLGVVLNVLVVGLTSFTYSQVLARDSARWNSPEPLPRVAVPVLSDIPLLGPALFQQTAVVYAMYVVVAVLSVALFRTRWGLRVRAVGEHPKAADTAGIDVNAVRFRSVLLGGAVAGFGGAFYTLGSTGSFQDEMTAGQGFIALAALIFGRWTPTGALLAALLFGFATNLRAALSIVQTPIPGEFLLMAPYLVTILAVAGLVGKVRAPAADGVAYRP